jgi:ApbE superfamily uncharacterized protein (UPF0280 family)
MSRRKKAPDSYRFRSYRSLAAELQLVSSYFRLRETDLHILAERDVCREASELATRFRLQIERYIARHPDFASSLQPLEFDPLAPPIIGRMLGAANDTGVGPMAAVAGGIAEYVGTGLLEAGCREIIVENGGDIFLKRSTSLTVSVFAGESPLSNRLGLRIDSGRMPLGICTSSGTVGHSLSFGLADSVTVLADSAFIADAAATRLGNEVGAEEDPQAGINRALGVSKTMVQLRGVLIIRGETIGAVGEVELVPLSGEGDG